MPLQKSQALGAIAMVFGVFGLVAIGVQFTRLSAARDGSFGMMDSAVSFGSFGMPGNTVAVESAPMMKSLIGIVPPMPGGGSIGADVAQADRLIIKSGNLSLVVRDVPKAIEDIGAYAAAHKGFVVSSNVEKSNRAFVGFVTVRVPAASFDESMAALRAFGDVQSQSVSGQDVTGEFTDVESQLRNLKATEAQFLSILGRAEKIEDILSVQRELANVRSQIEYTEGRKKYLSESAALSSITVSLSTDPNELPVTEDADKWKPLATIKDAARDLVNIAKGFGNFLIRLVVYVPLWAALAILGWGLFRLGVKAWKKWVV
ncbi:MAG: DUF4349 domain-containing protein [Candidatus Paceibacterota bacterium]|jgi:hypothetical protein